MPLVRSAILCTISLISAGLCLAQQDTGIITGVVTDQSGSAVPNASVSLLNTGTNTTTSVTTDNDGLFVATPLRIGPYTITIEARGFKKTVRENVLLRVQDRLRLDFSLEVGQLTETIEVTCRGAYPTIRDDISRPGDRHEARRRVAAERTELHPTDCAYARRIHPAAQQLPLPGFPDWNQRQPHPEQ